MPLTLLTGPANAEKARVVLDAYEAQLSREPILVVPTWADMEAYRRELADRGVVFGARVERWKGLERIIAGRAGVSGRALGPLGRERLATLVVRRSRLQVLGDAATTRGFVPALLALVDELAEQRVDAARWWVAVRAWAREEPQRAGYAEDLGTLVSAWQRGLEQAGRRDPAQRATAALDVLRTEPERWGGTPVLLYGFDDLTVAQRDAVETLAGRVGADVTVSLPHEPGRVAFAGRHTTVEELRALAPEHVTLPPNARHYAPAARPVLHHLERFLFETEADPAAGDFDPPARVPAGQAVRLLRGGGERAELELVGAHVKALIAGGMAPGEIAVVLRRPEEHAALLSTVLAGHDVPFALTRRLPVGHTSLGRGVLALARCALLPEATPDDLLAYLRTPGRLERPAFADALEVEARQQGWRTAAEARERWEAERFPLDAIDRVRSAAARGPAALCERLAAETDSLFAGPFRRRAPVLDATESVDASVAAALRSALRELGGLVDLDAALVPEPAELLELLGRLTVYTGRRPGPDVVTVADPKDVRARRVRAVFLCGLQEGTFPAPSRPEPFLGDDERRALNAASGLRLRAHDDQLGAERYLLYTTVSRPTDLLVLSWHAADEEGRPQVRSLFVDDVLDLLEPDLPVEDRRLGAAGFDPAEGVAAPTPREATRAEAARAPRVAARPIARLADPLVLRALREQETWSASAIESWLACPVKWFVERRLRPQELVPDPEPMIRGQAAHLVLERALERVRADGPRPLVPGDLPEVRRLAHEAIEQLVAKYRLSPSPERARGALRRLEHDVLRYLDWAVGSDSAFGPAELELAFGGVDSPHPAVTLGAGLRLAGRIDRVDRGPDGAALVYDYKGRTVKPHAGWAKDGKLQLALYMLVLPQLLEDVRAEDVAGGLYQPIGNPREERPRGLLREDADPGLKAVPTDRVDDETFAAVLEGARARAIAAVEEIRGGHLTPKPGGCAYQGGCSYPAICRGDRG